MKNMLDVGDITVLCVVAIILVFIGLAFLYVRRLQRLEQEAESEV